MTEGKRGILYVFYFEDLHKFFWPPPSRSQPAHEGGKWETPSHRWRTSLCCALAERGSPFPLQACSGRPTSGQTDRQKAIHAKCPKGWLCDCLGEGLFSWGKNHPCNHHESYQECATWNQYQKQHYKDGLSLALHRPTATAPGADSELFFLIDFSATTYPSPSPASPRGWLARSPCLVPPGGHGTAGTVPHGPAVTRTDGCYTEQEKYKPWALMA